jgi:hypothetical protein
LPEYGRAVHVGEEPGGATVIRRRALLHRITWSVVLIILGLAVIDGLGVLDVFGVDTGTVSSSGGGVELSVEHPTVSRPALASPFRITVTKDGGWDDGEQVKVAVRRDYLELWDLNGVLPGPADEEGAEDPAWVVWAFDAPAGDRLVVTYEARIEPGVQLANRRGAVAVLDDDDEVLAEVSFTTRVMP